MNIFKLFKGAKFYYDQIKEGNVIRSKNIFHFLFLTTLNHDHREDLREEWKLFSRKCRHEKIFSYTLAKFSE